MNKPKELPKSIQLLAQAFPLTASVHEAEDGRFWVEAIQLGGCFAEGESVSEALHNFKFAIYEYFEVPKKLQLPNNIKIETIDIPDPVHTRKPAPVKFIPTGSLAFAC